MVYRSFSQSGECREGQDAIESGCVTMVTRTQSEAEEQSQDTVFFASASTFSSPGSDLVPNVITVYAGCPNGMYFLGELGKYVSVSTKRFEALSCTTDGITVKIRKSVGEEVTLAFLIPQVRPSGDAWLQVHTHHMSTSATVVSVVFSMDRNESRTFLRTQ